MHMHVHVDHLSAWFYKTCQLRIAYLISETPGVIFTLTILLAPKKKNTKTKKTTQNHRTTGVVSPLVNIHERAYKNFIIGSPVVNYRLWYQCLFMTPPPFASAIFNLRFPFLLFIITTWPWRYCWFAKNSVKWLQLFIE